MFELIKSMAFALVMVPVVTAGILCLIYGFGELFNMISRIGHSEKIGRAHV